MIYNAYFIRNNLSGISDGIMLYKTDAYACARTLEQLKNANADLNEYSLFCCGSFDNESGRLIADNLPTLIEWNSRSLKESAPVSTDVNEIVKDINGVK